MSIRSFLSGLILGAAMVAGVSVFADGTPPRIVGDAGILRDYEVIGQDGKRICEDPAVHPNLKAIRCE